MSINQYMRRWTKNLFLLALLISLFLHMGTGALLYFKRGSPAKSNSVEVVIVDKNPNKNDLTNKAQQIVEQSEKRINDEIDEKAKYLSRYDQKVVDPTKAQRNGRFQNDAKMGEAKKAQENKVALEQKTKTPKARTPVAKPGDTGLPHLADLKPQFQWDRIPPGVQNPGPVSQTDDFLKDLKTGPQTLLSTREFVYYTYYNRIKERLRLFWEPKIKEKVTRLFAAGRHLASNEEKITKLVIILDKEGKILKVQVLSASGVQDLDDAAIEAFEAAAPFPNPPSGIVEADGTIKIRWDFILEANSNLLSPPPDNYEVSSN